VAEDLDIKRDLFAELTPVLKPDAVLSTTTSMRWRQLFPGALFAAIGWSLLKIFGATWVSNQVADANALYGTLGGVIALMLLFYSRTGSLPLGKIGVRHQVKGIGARDHVERFVIKRQLIRRSDMPRCSLILGQALARDREHVG
jgi:hypothetical protein